jgi:3-hydroxybutyrate dehydrogenase
MTQVSEAQRTALITGSTSGIGLAIARKLAADGFNIVLNGRSAESDIEPLRQELADAHGVTVSYRPGDMADPGQIDSMIADAMELSGGIDVLVNNAGIQFVAPIEEFPTEKWNAILAIILSAAFHTTRTVLPYMREQQWGRIINIASAHGLRASPDKSAYVSAKHGLVGLTKTVALETAEAGITCNAICPGYVLTPLVKKQIPDTARARHMSEEDVVRDVMLAEQATKQFVKVEEIGALAAFLCTDSAASITGTTLSVDGGWTAQ